jgi:hypothetical protein
LETSEGTAKLLDENDFVVTHPQDESVGEEFHEAIATTVKDPQSDFVESVPMH